MISCVVEFNVLNESRFDVPGASLYPSILKLCLVQCQGNMLHYAVKHAVNYTAKWFINWKGLQIALSLSSAQGRFFLIFFFLFTDIHRHYSLKLDISLGNKKFRIHPSCGRYAAFREQVADRRIKVAPPYL